MTKFVRNIQTIRACPQWKDCMPKDTIAADQLVGWKEMPTKAFNNFVKWTGLRLEAGTRLLRNGGDHIFAVHPDHEVAVCVYRHSRTFGE